MIASARMTGAEFDALPYDEGRKWELVEGGLVEMPSPNAAHQEIVGDLYASIRSYLRPRQSGGVYPDIEFALGGNLRLRPDVAVILGENSRAFDPHANPISVAPDIAIEVISPSERTLESTRKVWIYIERGVKEVWQVFPETATVLIHCKGSTFTILRRADVLETSLLPSWSLPLAELFPA